MDATIQGGTFFDDVDPKLKRIAAEIRRMLEEHQVAGAFQLASSTHAEFGLEVPPWSGIWFEDQPNGDRALRIRSSSERDGDQHLESSAHMWLSMRDMALEQAAYLMHVGDAIEDLLRESGVEMEHTTLQEKARAVVPSATEPPK